jgi:hypothetical protein
MQARACPLLEQSGRAATAGGASIGAGAEIERSLLDHFVDLRKQRR